MAAAGKARRIPGRSGRGVVACILLYFLTAPAFAQNTTAQAPVPTPAADEDFHIYTDAPRVLLTKARLRRVQRERERMSMRWEQFDTLIAGGVPMSEPGFAYALYYRASASQAAGRKAVD